MAVAHRASIASGSTNPTTTFTITIPSSTVTNDVLFVTVTSRDHTAGTALPTVTDNDAGGNTWTQITGASSADRKATVWWKRATSGTASKTITVAGCVGSSSGGVSVYSGALVNNTPYTNETIETNGSGDETHATFDPTNDNSEVVFAVFNYANDNAVTSVSGATVGAFAQRFEHLSTGGSDCGNTQWGVALASGATGSITWAQTNGTTYSSIWAVKPDSTPTIALNTADATDFGSDTTPTVEFTGTDADGDSVRYNVQIDTSSSFNSVASGGANTYYFDASDAGATDPNSVWTNDANAFDGNTATSATVSVSGSTSSNYLKAEGTNAPSSGGNITQVRARVNDNSGSDIAEATIYTDGLAESLGSPQSPFGTGWGSYVVLSTPSGGWTWVKVAALEVKIYSISGAGGVTRVEVEVTSDDIPLLDKISGTDSGFANTTDGADTDPFDSGDKASFTVQAGDALSTGTYYWRARAKDPSGSNTYSSFATTRTFTINTGGTAVKDMIGSGFIPFAR